LKGHSDGRNTSTQQQTSQTNPYAGAAPALNGILNNINSLVPGAGSLTGAQAGALNTIEANANAAIPMPRPQAISPPACSTAAARRTTTRRSPAILPIIKAC
jgi:hypothetical protein